MSLNAERPVKEATGVNECCLGHIIQVKVRCNPKMTGTVSLLETMTSICGCSNTGVCVSVGEMSRALSQNIASCLCRRAS